MVAFWQPLKTDFKFIYFNMQSDDGIIANVHKSWVVVMKKKSICKGCQTPTNSPKQIYSLQNKIIWNVYLNLIWI